MAAGINDTFRQVGDRGGRGRLGRDLPGPRGQQDLQPAAGTPAATGGHPRQLLEAASIGRPRLGAELGAATERADSSASATREGFLRAERDPPDRCPAGPRRRRSPCGWSARTRSSARKCSRRAMPASTAWPSEALGPDRPSEWSSRACPGRPFGGGVRPEQGLGHGARRPVLPIARVLSALDRSSVP